MTKDEEEEQQVEEEEEKKKIQKWCEQGRNPSARKMYTTLDLMKSRVQPALILLSASLHQRAEEMALQHVRSWQHKRRCSS